MKASFHTLGCKLNYAETASLERQFTDRGFTVVPFSEPSDVCVINTCSVTERADREARQIVRRALRTSPGAFVAVIGCYAQLDPETIASIDGVDMVLGASEKFRLFDYADGFRKFAQPKVFVGPISSVNDFGPAYSGGVDDRTRAFLKVQDGCDFNCAFCTIPLARGGSRSQSIDACVAQARDLVRMGYKEIILTGVNVGDFGKHDGTSFAALLKAVDGVDGVERIRVSSIEPNLLTDEVIDVWLSSDKVCPHFHIPLQHGTDELLRKMRRRYTSEDYRNLIHSIRSRSADAGIGVDVIVGFPGETEELFKRNFDFIHALPVSYLHVFTYSERPNTPSVDFPGRVEPRIRYSHSDALRVLGQMKRSEFHRSQLGAVRPVLVEGSIQDNMLSGYTDNYVRVTVPYHPSLENTVAMVRIGEQTGEQCAGEVVRLVSVSNTITPMPHIPVIGTASRTGAAAISI
ncbi:MAG: tRNA (N(6)-L-threonylcarbamoyladenosine(37)-C(2))-methylthiotransferase MtaB [Bacteroidetes bacterium]|nr:tRNA (N(6)-L-threonylcarbamoyladenosine(37)-C(2))-methylthiotransferase MtaB [Bacteroidota bacterium]